MVPTIINGDAVQGETFLPGQIFIFGGFALWANSLGHLEQIDSYAPGHQIRFENLNYTADIRGDLIFDGSALCQERRTVTTGMAWTCCRTMLGTSSLQ